MLESSFQAHLIRELNRRFPGCVILKNDSGYLQGVPDLSIFFQAQWAMLEVKKSKDAKERPNQAYWIGVFNEMSFAAFIYPENEEEVLDGLQRTFQPGGNARFPKR